MTIIDLIKAIEEHKNMKKILYIMLLSMPLAQQLEPVDIAIDQLRTIVETASRSSQRVFVDDFTGLL